MGKGFIDSFGMTPYPAVSEHPSVVGHRCPLTPDSIIPLPAHHLSAWPGPMPRFGWLHPCPVPGRVAGAPHRYPLLPAPVPLLQARQTILLVCGQLLVCHKLIQEDLDPQELGHQWRVCPVGAHEKGHGHEDVGADHLGKASQKGATES